MEDLPRQAARPQPPRESDGIFASLCSCCTARDRDDYEPADRPRKSGTFNRRSFFSHNDRAHNSKSVRDVYDLREAKELGKGACGVVYRVTHKATKKQRALKLIQKAKVRHAYRFRREIEIMKRLEHPNICRLVETFEDDNYIYMAMEHVLGGELFDRLMAHKTFSAHDSARVLFHILSALSYMHEAKIVHRDLKPENIMFMHPEDANLCPPGKPINTPWPPEGPVDIWDLKLIDWGYATWCAKGHTLHTVCGTCYYIAPEVLTQNYDCEVDMWSVGVILYILLLGSPPFVGPDAQSRIMHAQFNDANLPPDAKDLVHACLTVDPKRRITAHVALQHRFVNPASHPARHSTPMTDMAAVMEQVLNFHRSSLLRRAALTMIAMQTSADEVAELRERFQVMDSDRNGLLDEGEIQQAVQSLYDGETSPHTLLVDLDTDGSGRVDYVEFLAATIDEKIRAQEAQVRETFRIFDVNKDGVIDVQDLEYVLDSYIDKSDLDPGLTSGIDYEGFKQLLIEGQRIRSRTQDAADAAAGDPARRGRNPGILSSPAHAADETDLPTFGTTNGLTSKRFITPMEEVGKNGANIPIYDGPMTEVPKSPTFGSGNQAVRQPTNKPPSRTNGRAQNDGPRSGRR